MSQNDNAPEMDAVPDDAPKVRTSAYVLALSQVGIEMVVPIALGVGLDVWLGTVPFLMISGVILGLVGGLVHLMAILKRMDRRESPPAQKPT